MVKTGWITKLGYLRFFLEGFETYFIAPTAWYYIRSFGETQLFLAFVLTAHNIGTVISSPLLGAIADRFGHPRFLFICSCVVKIFAYVIYSVNLHAFFPLVGRAIGGLASGGIPIVLGQIVLQTDAKGREGLFVFLMGMFILGSAVGPSIGSFISFRINIYGWAINEGNSPGIVMSIIWILFFILTLVLPKTIWVETGDRTKETLLISSDSDNDMTKLPAKYSSATTQNTLWDSRVACMFFLIFCDETFSSTATFYAPVLGMDHLHLPLIHIKLFFLNSTSFTLLLFLSFYIASKYFEDRKLLIFVISMEICAISFLAAIAFSWNMQPSVQSYLLLIYVVLGTPYFGYPLGSSIISKITDPRRASYIQGLQIAMANSAIVVSRVVISFVFTKESLLVYSSVLALLWSVAVIWYGIVYKTLVPKY